jgi:ATP-dependent Lon protease
MQIKNIKDLLLGVSKEDEKSASEPKQEVLLPFPLIPYDALIIVPIRSTVLLPQNNFHY